MKKKIILIFSIVLLGVAGLIISLWLRAKMTVEKLVVNALILETDAIALKHIVEIKANSPCSAKVTFTVRDLSNQSTQGLSQEQIRALQGGEPVSKVVKLKKGANVFNIEIPKFDLQGQGQVMGRVLEITYSTKFIKQYTKTITV